MRTPLKIICNLFFLLLLCNTTGFAQTVTVKVRGSDKKGLPGAAVQMMCVSDSSVKYNATDQNGVAKFDGIESTLFVIKMSYLGYKTTSETVMVRDNERSFDFRLKPDAVSLGEVTIEARRPLIRQEEDRMIIDPMPLVNSSTNTLEVLEKTPGLYVDQDGGIYLSGTSTAAIYINGREQKMSNQDISTLLRSLPPNSVQQIEVMRTPSTKYDASGSGGIINIVLKKGVKLGRFGSVSAGMNQGFYGNQFAGFTINSSNEKSTFYVNTNYNHNDRVADQHVVRELVSDTNLYQAVRTRDQGHQAYLGYGISYDAGDKINLTYDGRVNAGFTESKTKNGNEISDLTETLLAQSFYTTNQNTRSVNIQQDLGMIWKIDTGESQLDTKLSYNYNNRSNSQEYSTEYSSPFILLTEGEGDNLQRRHFIILQSDLTYQLPQRIKLETGIKSSYQDYYSDADYFSRYNDTLTPDMSRTNEFLFRENINAAYFQASKTFGKSLVVKAGVRMEHTYMDGHQSVPLDTSFLISRADWFPYIYVSRPLIKIFKAEMKGYLIYRRTINRPGYQMLNPYTKFVDEFLCEKGNPALKPQITDNYEINLSYEDTPIIAFGQNFTRDIFSEVTYKDPVRPGMAVKTYDNLGKNTETYMRLTVGIPPGSRYFFALGAQYNHNHYDGFYENEPFTYSRDSWRLFTFHSLTLWKNTRITVFGFMMVNGQQNFYNLKNFGQLNITISQSLLNNRLNISVNARDLLRTMKTRFELDQGSFHTYGDRYTDNQRFGINVRYNFGMKKKEEKRRMQQFDFDE
ncbi:MAG TPA: outer membrane beta-barrel family protein [Bacteroidales bacterium]|nr:outer membrane beta-barrel family protein [Bacteroidales bacterium]